MAEWELFRDVLSGASPALFPAFLVYALHKEWFVLGRTHKKTEERETFWQDLALNTLGVAARSTAVATQVVRPQLSREDQARLKLLEQLVSEAAVDPTAPIPAPSTSSTPNAAPSNLRQPRTKPRR